MKKNNKNDNFVNIELTIDEMAEVSKLRKQKQKESSQRKLNFESLLKTLREKADKFNNLESKETDEDDNSRCYNCYCDNCGNYEYDCDCGEFYCATCDSDHKYEDQDDSELEDEDQDEIISEIISEIDDFIRQFHKYYLLEEELEKINEIIDLSFLYSLKEEYMDGNDAFYEVFNKLKFNPTNFSDLSSKFEFSENLKYDLNKQLSLIQKKSILNIKNHNSCYLPIYQIIDEKIHINLISKLLELKYNIGIIEGNLCIIYPKFEFNSQLGLIKINDSNWDIDGNVVLCDWVFKSIDEISDNKKLLIKDYIITK